MAGVASPVPSRRRQKQNRKTTAPHPTHSTMKLPYRADRRGFRLDLPLEAYLTSATQHQSGPQTGPRTACRPDFKGPCERPISRLYQLTPQNRTHQTKHPHTRSSRALPSSPFIYIITPKTKSKSVAVEASSWSASTASRRKVKDARMPHKTEDLSTLFPTAVVRLRSPPPPFAPR